MDRTDGHQLVVNEYFEECLRQAQEREVERDEHVRRIHERDAAATRPPEGPAPTPGA